MDRDTHLMLLIRQTASTITYRHFPPSSRFSLWSILEIHRVQTQSSTAQKPSYLLLNSIANRKVEVHTTTIYLRGTRLVGDEGHPSISAVPA
jgi:hypothetical protein